MQNPLTRTYRYVRIGIALTFVAIVVSVACAIPQVGVLGSISAYYYSPARNTFVGALIAVAFGLFALAGPGWERVVLNAAALFAPLIAIVPTPLKTGGVDGAAPSCTQVMPCTGASLESEIANGLTVYLVIGVLVLALAVALGIFSPRAKGEPIRLSATWPSIAMTALVLLAVALLWMLAPRLVIDHGHLVAALLFFILIAAVAVGHAVVGHARVGHAPEARSEKRFRATYFVIAGVIVVDSVALTVVASLGLIGATFPFVLVGELIALVAFVVFWLIHTVHLWNEGASG